VLSDPWFRSVPYFVHAELLVDRVHAPRVEEDQDKKDEDRSLLGKPEAQIGSAHFDTRDERAQKNAEAVRTPTPR
jgi:hypothetical protein